nr:hypothetical protein YSBCXYJI_YSBCXYJI_CDS_0020 [Caudoviricetes sp.]
MSINFFTSFIENINIYVCFTIIFNIIFII